MKEYTVLGIDCGGTHTDGAILKINGRVAQLLASAKTPTKHEDLPASVREVLALLMEQPHAAKALEKAERATLGTTLEINALVQNRADRVGLALTAGPGLDALHFAIGNDVCLVPGGLDHRGIEVEKLYTGELEEQARQWREAGVQAIACVGKFSPRNPAHENDMGAVAAKASGLPVTLGHKLSGRLNFPRRIATAYYNAAVARLHAEFLDAIEEAFSVFHLHSKFRLLKADGGAIPFAVSRREPVQSILSGPAASVMGVLALWPGAASGCSLLLDVGGTTTDIAIFLDGSPVVDRQGMLLQDRRTLVNSLASASIAVGGDSLLAPDKNSQGKIVALPLRKGPAMAFGGEMPTLLDALNVLDAMPDSKERGNIAASRAGLEQMAASLGMNADAVSTLAKSAVADALAKIADACSCLVRAINSRPIYTIAGLKSARQIKPQKACLVGGPAHCLAARLADSLKMPVEIAPHPDVANAIGAALTIPTAWLEVYVDTGRGELSAPAINYTERVPSNYTLEAARETAMRLLARKLESEGSGDADTQIVEADLFATLDDRGRGAKDMRVACQARPGIIASLSHNS